MSRKQGPRVAGMRPAAIAAGRRPPTARTYELHLWLGGGGLSMMNSELFSFKTGGWRHCAGSSIANFDKTSGRLPKAGQARRVAMRGQP